MARISHDPSHNHRCKVHGHRASGYFIRPEANEAFSAFYCCSQRPSQLGMDVKPRGTASDHQISRDDAMVLMLPCEREG